MVQIMKFNSETKDKILEAAKKILSEKGLGKATISGIAQKAGVTDSVIYHYFKNKEDLLFSLIGLYLGEIRSRLEDQLGGILEPISRLSKMIWFLLNYSDTNPIYSRLLLFECRSNRNFYQHQSYQMLRHLSGIIMSILENGIKIGVFRDDVNMRIVRELILGTIDLEIINSITTKKTELSTSDLQGIMNLIRAMIEFAPDRQAKAFNKSSRIFLAAEKIFSTKGYNQSTISEIASQAGVAEGTVYEYYNNKTDLLLAIPKVRFQEHIEALKEVFEIKTPIRKLRRYIRHHFLLYLAKPEFLGLFLLNIQFNRNFYSSEAYTTYKEYTKIIDEILEEGMQDGSIRKDVDKRIFKNLFLGGFSHLALRWLFLEPEPFEKSKEIDKVVNLLTAAVETAP
jgi:TetR/AcrR family transcriptional regulator, fatty acid metabolism regulator protein